ncbi:hypothetical protein BDZ89DRAFT_1260656 [Hymenopellis radicata]|nr:hypothetical protein BDZ89DRAFT_1260656 [Hymenopellis radicata]
MTVGRIRRPLPPGRARTESEDTTPDGTIEDGSYGQRVDGSTPRSRMDGNNMSSRDIVAIFHVSFHPTMGNIVDWSAVADAAVSLENVEFSALPSGLHHEDVMCACITPSRTPPKRPDLAVRLIAEVD